MELLNFSYFEEEFRKIFLSDLTFSSILNLCESFSKWKLICATYDEFQKFRSISILIKSWNIYLSIERITPDNIIWMFDDDDLEAFQLFLLKDLEFIEYHLNELKSYFNIRSDSVENIVSFQSQIKIIRKPISDGINKKLISYLAIFLQKIQLFKNVFLDLWPPFENNFRNILKSNLVDNIQNANDVTSTSNVKFTFRDMKEFMKNFSGTNQECLSEIHKLCRNSELQNTIKKSLQIKQWGSDGIEPELVKNIQNSFANFKNFYSTFIYKISPKSSLKYVNSDQNWFTGVDGEGDDECDGDSTQLPEILPEADNQFEINNQETAISKTTKRKLYIEHSPSFVDQSLSIVLDDISTVNHPLGSDVSIKRLVAKPNSRCRNQSPNSGSESTTIANHYLSNRINIYNNLNSIGSASRTCSAFSNLRTQWNLNESLLIYKGVQEGLTWSDIKSTYFRNSFRTNVHIKDRWRVILKKPELMNELQVLLESENEKNVLNRN